MNKNKQKVYDAVVPPLVERLQQVTPENPISPWSKQWSDDGSESTVTLMGARNGVSNRPYSGINWLILNLLSSHSNQNYYTLNQLKQITGLDRPVPDEVWNDSYDVVFFKMIDTKEKDINGKARKMPMMKTYKVWNHEQIPGLPVKPIVKAPDFNPKTEIDRYLTNLQLAGGVHLGGNRACYIPSQDAICLPNEDAFYDKYQREATAAHEGIHATGAKHRLDRKSHKDYHAEGDFNAYAFEELVAELGAAMTCTALGIPLDNLQHTEYIHSWIKRLQNDVDYIFKAAAHASRAFEYLSACPQHESTQPLACAA